MADRHAVCLIRRVRRRAVISHVVSNKTPIMLFTVHLLGKARCTVGSKRPRDFVKDREEEGLIRRETWMYPLESLASQGLAG